MQSNFKKIKCEIFFIPCHYHRAEHLRHIDGTGPPKSRYPDNLARAEQLGLHHH